MHLDYSSRCRAGFFILFILAASTSCAHREYSIPHTRLNSPPAHTEIAEVPFYLQQSHQCGPAALAMILNWSGSNVTPEEISGEIFTPGRRGSLQPMLVSVSRYHSRLPYGIRDFEALIQEVAAGHPVVVLQNLGLSWYPLWHYAVVIGYDIEKQIVILHSGKVFRKETGWSLFNRTWERADNWGLVVLPLDELPASADEESYLETVLTLEAVGKYEEASIAYKTALRRWSKSLTATMGLGNSLCVLGHLREAEEAFRSAVSLCPASGDAYNNLATVLAQQKRYDEAMDAAHKAIRLGGPNESMYHETLREINVLGKKGG